MGGLASAAILRLILSYVSAAAVVLLFVVKLGLFGLAHRFGESLLGGWLGAREKDIDDK